MYKRIILKKRPDEKTFPHKMDIFDFVESPIPTEIKERQVIIKVLYAGIDPVMRVWLSGAKTYIDSVQLESTVPAFGIGICIQSKSKKFKQGDIIVGPLELAEYCIRDDKIVYIIPGEYKEDHPDLPLYLSVYGVTGLTAIFGLRRIEEKNLPEKNDKKQKTLVVSSAAGSTGSYAVQVGKHQGYRVVGICSGQEKVDFVKGLGAEDCVWYNQAKDENGSINVDKLSQLIKKACPNGINAYFDNAGEQVFDAVLPNMADFGNIVLCGATATYNSWSQRGGLQNTSAFITKRLKAIGFLVFEDKNASEMYQYMAEMIELVNDGHVKHQNEYLDGLDKAPNGLQKVFLGKNQGKVIIRICQTLRAKL